jgi:sensor histidine kinase YesM
MKPVWYNRKGIQVLLHIIAWTALFALPFLMRTSFSNHEEKPREDQSSFVLFYILSNALWVGFFYLNAFVLLRFFLFKRRYWQYFTSQIVVLIFIMIMHQVLFSAIVHKNLFDPRNFIIFNLFPYLFILASSIAYRMIIDKVAADKQIKEKETENLKTELSFLRSQVSPHFMFNVLNNMVALARKKSELLEPSLIKLSSLMRYMLYEADEEKVSLEKEIEYLQSYIDLQQQRFGKKVQVDVSLLPLEGNYEIEPMLLIPFVENAFKHGTGMIECAQIDIHLYVKNDILYFSVHNRYNGEDEETKDKTSGIGLTNVKRRLKLLYGQNQSLLITKRDNWFTASLQLKLH